MMSDHEISPEDLFRCRQCGDCCRGYGGTFLNDKEIDAIAGYLGLRVGRFRRKYCQTSGVQPVLAQAKNGYCVFFDGLCAIHPVKPKMCQKWPFIESVLVDVGNWHIMAQTCPGIETNVSEQALVKCVRAVLRGSLG
jgi:Fe-S-cluster containining protein